MSDKYKVISTSPLWIKQSNSSTSESIGTLASGSIIDVTQISSGWYQYSAGWVYGFSSDNKILLEKVEAAPISATTTNIKYGDSVKIVGTGALYADSASLIPNWVKENTHTVSELSDDKTKVLLGFPNGIRSWVYTSDLTIQDSSSKSISVPSEQTSTLAQEIAGEKFKSIPQEQLSTSPEYGENGTEVYNNYINLLNGLRIKTLRGVHGMPYQYMALADTRISNDIGAFGRKYAEKIVARMPLLLMTPGSPEFLSGYSENEKKSVIEYAMSMFSDKGRQSDLDALLKREGKYYSLKFDWVGYYDHVNPMCRAAARFIGVDSIKLDGKYLDNYDWSQNNNEEIHKNLAYKGALAFYIHSDTQISDSLSTSTAESMLASKVNGLSDMGREINFLLGGAGALTGMKFDEMTSMKNLDQNMQNTQDATSKILGGGGGIIQSITGGIQTLVSGGKLIFPEIWSDSSFARSYDINIKLTTPDCDKLSWYLNICVPIMHLIGLVAPRQAGINGYISPFLIRAFYKGLFNCDMGIITNMSINKGQEGSWTKDGLPTVVDVNFSIKDLYSIMSITSNKTIKHNLMNNITLMDYIANICGVNINEPDIKRTIDMYLTQNVRNRIVDTVRLNIAGGLDQWATNNILKIYNKR